MTIPNMISIGRTGIALVIALLLVIPHAVWVVQLLFFIGAVSDKLDGYIARRTGSVSKLGADVLEPIADGSLIWAGVVYAVLRLDLPVWIVWYGAVLVALGFAAIVYTRVKTGRWYTGPMLQNKAPVGLGFFLVLWYMFELPAGWVLLATGVVLGAMALVDLLQILFKWKPKKRK